MDIENKKTTLHCCTIHKDVVEKVKLEMETDENFEIASSIFSALSDKTRLKIVGALLQNEMCVCDIANLLEMTHSATSHQLGVLNRTHIVKTRKDGKVKYYSLDDNHIKQLFEICFQHTKE